MAATEIQQGIASIYAMDGATMVVLTGTAYIRMNSASMTQQFDLAEEKGQGGEVEQLIASNEHYDYDVEFVPIGNSAGTNTRAQAITSAANSKPGIITKVVLSGFSVAAFNGNCNCIPGLSWRMGKDSQVVMTMRLRRYVNNNTALTAGVISG